MPRLAELQRAVRDAVVSGHTAAVRPDLVGGCDPERRLAIHRRHYQASLVRTLLTRFPALTWLVGGAAIQEAADLYVREHPPAAPCLAEYGEGFPAFVASHLGRPDAAYVRPFGELEWHLGAVSIAVDLPAAAPESFPRGGDVLASATVVLQPGLRYLRAEWPVHDLMERFLTDTAPDVYDLRPAAAWIEIRGARGEFEINELEAAVWTFRSELQRALSLEAAAMRALAVDETFDPGQALATLVTAGLLAEIRCFEERNPQ
jgi:hypothetical protein